MSRVVRAFALKTAETILKIRSTNPTPALEASTAASRREHRSKPGYTHTANRSAASEFRMPRGALLEGARCHCGIEFVFTRKRFARIGRCLSNPRKVE